MLKGSNDDVSATRNMEKGYYFHFASCSAGQTNNVMFFCFCFNLPNTITQQPVMQQAIPVKVNGVTEKYAVKLEISLLEK